MRSWLIWLGLPIILLSILLAYLRLQPRPGPALPVFGQVPDFTLTNQAGQRVTAADLRGHVWVANVIFTRCPGPCPQMTRRLKEVQAAVPADWPVRFVSLTSDPDYDTPAVLKQFADKFAPDFARWHFLTGPKPELRDLAVHGLKLVVMETDPKDRKVPEDLFIHSTLFIVVDQQGRLRQSVESLEPPAQQQTLAAIRALLQEKR